MATFEDLVKANDSIKKMPIKGKEYAVVPERLKAFRMVYPNGSIITEIYDIGQGIVTMKATVMDESGRILGIGHAQEKEESSYINKTSFIENCETSAVGRALGMAGFGFGMSVASAEEVANAMINQIPEAPEELPVKRKEPIKPTKALEFVPFTEGDLKGKTLAQIRKTMPDVYSQLSKAGSPELKVYIGQIDAYLAEWKGAKS